METHGTTSWEVDDHTIALNDDHLFIVSGPLFVHEKFDRTFSTFREASSAIKDKAALADKAAKASRRVALPALDSAGNPITIKGIHATQFVALGVPDDPAGVGDSKAYPAVPWLKNLLIERLALAKRRREIEVQLYRYRIERNRGYRIAPAEFDAAIESLEREHARQTEKAVAETPETSA